MLLLRTTAVGGWRLAVTESASEPEMSRNGCAVGGLQSRCCCGGSKNRRALPLGSCWRQDWETAARDDADGHAHAPELEAGTGAGARAGAMQEPEPERYRNRRSRRSLSDVGGGDRLCLGASSVTAKEPGLESIGAGADNPEPAMTAGASVGAGWPLSVLR